MGYREAVAKLARKIQVSGFVENLKPYDVRIVAEGDDTAIDTFIERIKIKKFPIDVESVKVSFEDYKGEFPYFEIKTGEWQEELLERFDTAGTLLYKCMELGEKNVKLAERSVELGERTVKFGEKNVELSEKVADLSEKSVALSEESVAIGKNMLDKQDNTIGAIREVSEKIDHGKEEIVTEIKSLREDLKSYMTNKFAKIEHEIEGIKAKIGMV